MADLLTVINIGGVAYPKGEFQIIAANDAQEGVDIKFGEKKTFSGVITNLSDKVNEWLSTLNYNNQVVQLALIGKEGRWYFGKKGVKASMQISEEHMGGARTMVRDVLFTWYPKQNEFQSASAIDADYLLLDNPNTIGTFTPTDEGAGVSADSISGYENLGGIDFGTYPILYAKVVSDTDIRWFDSAAARTIGTAFIMNFNPFNAALTSGVGFTITGNLTIENTDITAADNFTVTFN